MTDKNEIIRMTPTHVDTQEEAMLKLAWQSAYDAVKATLLSHYRTHPDIDNAKALEFSRQELKRLISGQRAVDTLSKMAVESVHRLTGRAVGAAA